MYSYSIGALLIPVSGGGAIVMYVVGFGKEFMSRSLSISSMVHVEGIMLCLGRRDGEMGDGGSALGDYVTRVGELNVSEVLNLSRYGLV